MALWFFFLLAAAAAGEPPSVKQNQQNYLTAAMADMRSQSYNGFVILLQLLNNPDFLNNTEVTFLMPSDNELSQAELNSEKLHTFVLSHTIPRWLMISHMAHLPNGTLVPSSIVNKKFIINNAEASGLFFNNAKIVSPNVCTNSRISCHGISNVIAFPNVSLSPVTSPVEEIATLSTQVQVQSVHHKVTTNKKKGKKPNLPVHQKGTSVGH